MCTEKEEGNVPQISVKGTLRDSPSLPDRTDSNEIYTARGRKKNISRQGRYAGGRKGETRSTQACARAWQCISCRSACPRWRTRVCRYRETISKTTPPETRLYVDDVTGGAHARISVRVDRYPPSAGQAAEGAFTRKMSSRIARRLRHLG